MKARGLVGHALGKNPGDVWQMPTSTYRGDHHAGFPLELIRRPLLASVPERVCVGCGTPWARGPVRSVGRLAVQGELRARCSCGSAWNPGLVLDPFMGAGTVGVVAEDHQRDRLRIELNPEFAALAIGRIEAARAAHDSRSTSTCEEMPMAA